MATTLSRSRLLVLAACFCAASGYLSVTLRSEPALQRESFERFPDRLGEWSAIPTEPFSRNIIATLGVDEHVNRFYASGTRLAHLYIGYYGTQREGDAIHSPMNCLPGAGWLPISTGQIDLDTGGGTIRVNRYVIQKGLDQQVVVYWYQSHGRAIASDYWSKIYLVLDAIRLNRTDAALVRVIAPVEDSTASAAASAEQNAIALARAAYAQLGRYLPL